MMIKIGNKIYKLAETGEWLICGKIIPGGLDGNVIEWYK